MSIYRCDIQPDLFVSMYCMHSIVAVKFTRYRRPLICHYRRRQFEYVILLILVIPGEASLQIKWGTSGSKGGYILHQKGTTSLRLDQFILRV